MSLPARRFVFLGLSLSSSWGNGHATTYRALLKALAARGHDILFLERDRPWYAAQRDLVRPNYCRLRFYRTLAELRRWGTEIAAADAVIVGSYVPDGVAVARFVQRCARGVTAFYDIDTPVTLAKLAAGDHEYLTPELIGGFDLYLSFTGGPVLRQIERRFGVAAARPLYCSVDPELYRALDVPPRWDLGYLGTYSPDRQAKLDALLIEPARRLPQCRFVVAGAQYPDDICWPANIDRFEHLPPAEHAEFYASQRWTLNLTRAAMAASGHSPSVRLFEAAACACPIVSDPWPGLDTILAPGREVALARRSSDIVDLLLRPEADRLALGRAGQRRVIAAHTAAHRAIEFEAYLREAQAPRTRPRPTEPSRPRAPAASTAANPAVF